MITNFCFIRLWILFFSLFYSIFAQSQNQTTATSKELVKIAEGFYGTDDRLANGIISHFYAPRADGHPFFLNGGWQNGEIYSNGVKYSNLAIKYNIERDQIYFINQNNNLATTIILNNTFIDSLKISNHVLINTAKIAVQSPVGFVELLYDGKIKSFLKHKVHRSVKQTDTYEYFKFNRLEPVIYIIKDAELIGLKSRKNFISEFSPHEKLLTKFLRQNDIQFKKANRTQLIHLLKYCDGLSSF